MLIRIIDYVGNPGGGVRFTLEMLGAWLHLSPEIDFELVSDGSALDRYAALFEDAALGINLRRVPAPFDGWSYQPPASILSDGADILWFPWMHRHRVPVSSTMPVIASLHDVILLERGAMFDALVAPGALEQERRITQDWLRSDTMIVASSRATVQSLQKIFAISADRCQTIPICGSHSGISTGSELLILPEDWGWTKNPFLLCPANISPHKNHETLLAGVAKWGRKIPLALTGQATHLHACQWSRAVELRDFAIKQGFTLGHDLITLGYVSDPVYYGILNRAWALIMPTLAEGGGSFPVAEAVELGIPVICSDIPVLREQMERMNACVQWFDPRSPASLAERLAELSDGYPRFRAKAADQKNALLARHWSDVAGEYESLMLEALPVRK